MLMEKLRSHIGEAKEELKNTLKIPGDLKNQFLLEFSAIEELEKQLRKQIQKGEKILKQLSIKKE